MLENILNVLLSRIINITTNWHAYFSWYQVFQICRLRGGGWVAFVKYCRFNTVSIYEATATLAFFPLCISVYTHKKWAGLKSMTMARRSMYLFSCQSDMFSRSPAGGWKTSAPWPILMEQFFPLKPGHRVTYQVLDKLKHSLFLKRYSHLGKKIIVSAIRS